MAFYNPASRTRRSLLGEARDILAARRPGAPVLLASNLGREGEALKLRRIEELDVAEVDMLTLVLVGSSASRLVETADGPRLYTPRGYAVKLGGTGAPPPAAEPLPPGYLQGEESAKGGLA